MLKIDIDSPKNCAKITTSGTGKDILCDLALVINAIYKSIEEHEPLVAAEFRMCLQATVNDPRFWAVESVRGFGFFASWPGRGSQT